MRKITVSGNGGYDILIKNGILASCGQYVRKVTKASRALIISDSNVFSLYGQAVASSLAQNGFTVASHVFPAGEASKNLNTVEGMIKALCENELSRNDIVVALGGGVTGDMAGFASAIYLRGIDFVQIPTTLLSQVDSSVGGKTGCDLAFGKNLIGAFHNPKLVLIDPETIKTLPDRYKNDGMGEIIKYALIKSEALYEKLASCNNIDSVLSDVIYTCVDIKRQVVENDFTEKGERMLLNFGHTLGHAIEKHQNFSGLAHGEAVGVGMLKITKAAERAGLAGIGTAQKIETLLNKFSLPTAFSGNTAELVNIMLYDKKRRGNSINLVIAESVGSSFVKAFPITELEGFFAEA
ncbi:MAG: 3-dehydroquinate synthase [Clostridia bacterium]|nr:3-dehydroquinate synthase [Clostridia bacterium]